MANAAEFPGTPNKLPVALEEELNRVEELIAHKETFRMLKESLVSRLRENWEENKKSRFAQVTDFLGTIKNREVALAAIQKSGGYVYPYLAPEFQNDKDIILKVCNRHPYLFKLIPEEFKHDRDTALATASSYDLTKSSNQSDALLRLPEEFQHDRQFVLEFMTKNGMQFEVLRKGNQISPVLREFSHDKEISLAAVKSSPVAIQYLADELKNDRDIVLTAVKAYGGSALAHWSAEDPYPIEGFDTSLAGDIEIATEAVKKDPSAIEWIPKDLRNDPRIAELLPS